MAIWDKLFKQKTQVPQLPTEAVEAGEPQGLPEEAGEQETLRAQIESAIDKQAQFSPPQVKERILGWVGTLEANELAVLDTTSTITESGKEPRVERETTSPNIVDESIQVFSRVLGKNLAPETEYSIKEAQDLTEETPTPIPDPNRRIREEVGVNVYKTQAEGVFWIETATKFIQRNDNETLREVVAVAKIPQSELGKIRGPGFLEKFDSRASDILSRMSQKVPVTA